MGLTLNVVMAIDNKFIDLFKMDDGAMYHQGLEIPYGDPAAAVPNISTDDIVNYITDLAGDFETVYHSPETFKLAFCRWWNANHYRWVRLYHTAALTYNPISNYDRTEEWTDTNETTAQETGENATTANGTSTITGNAERTEKVAAFDSDSMVGRNSHNENSTNTAKDSSSTSGTATRNTTNTQKATRKGRAYGNIGVTTTQEMLKAEREILKFEILEIIVEEYKKRFCILVY